MSLRDAINGENWRLNVEFEYTAKTPERNSRTETKIFHLCNKTRAALFAANIPVAYKYSLFRWFFMWCVQPDMLQVVTVNGSEGVFQNHQKGIKFTNNKKEQF